MKMTCISCGAEIEAFKGNRKYCQNCRAEIELYRNKKITFKEAAKYVCDLHEQERVKFNYRRKLNSVLSIDYIVKEAMKNHTSYGKQVAIMEGRLK